MRKLKEIFGEQEDEFLRAEIVFPVNTDAARFYDWATEKIDLQFRPSSVREQLRALSPEDGRFSSLAKKVHNSELMDFQKEYPGFGWVLFELLPIGTDRTEVSIAYTDKAFLYMTQILEMIAKAYVETAQPIQEYMKPFALAPITQIASRLNLTADAVKKLEELQKKIRGIKTQVGQMMAVPEMDIFIQYVFEFFPTTIYGWKFDRQEINEKMILYPVTVWDSVKAAPILLGIYRVSEGPNGEGRCGWQPPLPKVAPHHERLRELVDSQVLSSPANLLFLYRDQFNKQSNISKQNPTQTQESEPWKLSRPSKQERDKIIWEMRNKNHTWEEILDELDSKNITTGISTLKENYDRMKELVAGTSMHP